MRDKVKLENQERRERGPRVGHYVFYKEVKKILTSRLFLALGTEGKRNSCRRTLMRKCQSSNLEKWWQWQRHHSRKHGT